MNTQKAISLESPPKKLGRKPGKHSNEDYTQTSIYLPIKLRNQVRARLYELGLEMSGLVEDMLRDWLRRDQLGLNDPQRTFVAENIKEEYTKS